MDAKRVEFLMNVARSEQHRAFQHWNSLSARAPAHLAEAARLDCAEWAKAGDELYKILERQHKETTTNG